MACGIFKQIVEAVYYCHTKEIFHGALQAENIFIEPNNHVKLSGIIVSINYTFLNN